MELLDLFRVGLRWAHALAAVTWVGGGLFYLFVLSPAFNKVNDSDTRRQFGSVIALEFRGVVRTAIPVFLVSGALLTLDRLTRSQLPPSYVVVLGLKVAMALWMFWLAQRLGGRESRYPSRNQGVGGVAMLPVRVSAPTLIVALGVMVYLLAIILKVLYENALRASSGL
ncbi:MAG: hypothetical protein HW403_1276 [Dehalococcoidia bacterium]|nr:hypothetical protein [Dehalococcoidia bacterium]